jgi:hypothetical protein
MAAKQLKERISNTLETELSKIYDELGITNGDISPLDSYKWDELTEELATLFQALIAWNTDEE